MSPLWRGLRGAGMSEFRLEAIPEKRRKAFGEFALTVRGVFGEHLKALVAFGGWVVDDPFFAEAPATSVLLTDRVDLVPLDKLARAGVHFGRRGVRAPLIMTREYIEASRDAFPLELLEIQQVHVTVYGDDPFCSLTFRPEDVRLQCERDLKSELIQMRQGLLAAAGRHRLLHEIALAATERTVRVLRGLLHLSDPEAPPRTAAEIVERASKFSGVALEKMATVVNGTERTSFEQFVQLYEELENLARRVDSFDTARAAADASKSGAGL